MRAPVACAAFALLLSASLIPAQEPPTTATAGEQTAHHKGEGENLGSSIWAWANFAILAGLLGYLTVKKGGPWFASRSQSIRQGIAEAEEIRAKAEASAAQVDRRLASLETEIEKLRANARREQAAEAERIRLQSAADLSRIQEHATREIDSAAKGARLELKRYAAQLAVDLAEQKIRRQMTPQLQSALVENFARDLERPSASPHLKK
jgi:F-type H+-transporting ATPase subunit b